LEKEKVISPIAGSSPRLGTQFIINHFIKINTAVILSVSSNIKYKKATIIICKISIVALTFWEGEFDMNKV